MISPPARNFLNSSFVNVTSLRAIEGEPVLEISAGDAAARGIASGQRVRIFNDRGSIVCKARRRRARPARRRQRPRRLVEEARPRRQERQRADAPAADRHRPRAELLRLPGRGRARRHAGRGVRRGARMAAWSLGAVGASALLASATVCLTSGCSTIGYYAQAATGHLALLEAARPVPEWLADPATSAALKQRLALRAADPRLRRQRAGRARQRQLPPLCRPASRRPRSGTSSPRPSSRWCPRPGASRSSAASATAATTSAPGPTRSPPSCASEGLDVAVYGVPAYSTLGRLPTGGWFADPLLNTFIDYPEGELARLIFHELAHQVAFAPGDTLFNESFASTVEKIGAERWLARHGSAAARSDYDRAEARRADFAALDRRAIATQLARSIRQRRERCRQARRQGRAAGAPARRLRRR